MTRIVVPLAAPTVAGLLERTRQAAAEGADWVEWRLDTAATQGCDPVAAVAAIPQAALPVLVTIRHPSERGTWMGTEDARATLLQAADEAGAAAIDCEYAHRAILGVWRPTRAKLILSAHDFEGLGGDLPGRIAAMRAAGADLPKVAVMARDAADLAVVRDVVVNRTGDVIALAMGEHGLPSRLLAGVWGTFLTFARLEGDGGSAPGQPLARELRDRYRLHAQRADWPVYGVMGSPIAHSKSPLIHNAALAAAGLPGVYVPLRVEDAPAFWRACGAWIHGVSVTLPHKQALLDVATLEPLAQSVGALNTLWHDGGTVRGANTDAGAIISVLEAAAGSLAGKHALVLGAGGVARAAVHALAQAGARVTITNRTRARAEELAAEVGAAVSDDGAEVAYDLLVNCTSQGMGKPDETPWPPARHRPGTVVFDTVYTPRDTCLLRDAIAAGAIPAYGGDMFLHQAEAQFRRFTGHAAPTGVMARALAG